MRQAAAEGASRKALAGFGPREAERCLSTYLAAVRQRPDDWVLHYNLGLFYKELRQHSAAAQEFRFVVNEFPQVKRFRVALASELEAAGEKAALAEQLRESLKLDPDDAEIAQALRQISGSSPLK